MIFSDFNLAPEVLEGIESLGFTQPTPIQEQAIPLILASKDLIACAQTGTGKTAAFLLPLINRLQISYHDNADTLIIVPTRELALQIDQQLEGLSYFCNVSSIAIYGGGDGSAFEREKKALTSGASFIVATPGRLIAHLNMGYVKLEQLRHLVLDEADRMLDMGFFDDIMKIVKYLPAKRQNLMFSATMPPKIRQLTGKILVDPEHINIAVSKPAEGILQVAYLVYDAQKNDLITHLLAGKNVGSVIIFTSTRSKANKLERDLQKANVQAKAIHSDLDQSEREKVLLEFRNRKLQVIVATDILSRGIDIENIDMVVNYDVPSDPEDYIHRVGRTARAASSGLAITFINDNDQEAFGNIEKLIERSVHKLPLPEGMPPGPEYHPERRRTGGRKRFSKSHGKSGGKKRR